MKHTIKQPSDQRADHNAPPCVDRISFKGEHNIVENSLGNPSHETEQSCTSSTRDTEETRDVNDFEALDSSERTHNNVLEEMPSESTFDSQLEENTFNESAYENSLLPREQRPTRVRNEPNRLSIMHPGIP